MKKVQVLGPGCPKCQQVAQNVAQAAKTAGVEVNVEKVAKPLDIAKLGVMFTPGLVVDGELKASGRVPTVAEIAGWLAE